MVKMKIGKVAFVLTAILQAFGLSSCKSKKEIVGIIQFGSHESLNACRLGIEDGLRKSGINLDRYDIRRFDSDFQTDLSFLQAKELVERIYAFILQNNSK